MSQIIIQGTAELARAIKSRRNDLKLTIEEAATRAGVGTKTWSRYESGESIRKDKCKGICKALNWHTFPALEETEASACITLKDYKKHEAWSKYLAKTFGEPAAASFAIGSDILLDNIDQDMESLAAMPKGSHIGELDISWLDSLLPSQFLMRYNYDFLYAFHCTVTQLRSIAHAGNEIVAHSVLEELALYLIVEESKLLMESADLDDADDWDEWIFDFFDDMDVVTWLYSDIYVPTDNAYHFDHWQERQFYTDR